MTHTMSLLRDIQDSAVDSQVQLTSLLRKCKILSVRLGSAEFEKWIDNELNGYSLEDTVPEYRVLQVNSKGHFSGPFRSIRYADIPLSRIPEELHEILHTSFLTQSIASLESLVENATNGSAMEPWGPDLVAYVGRNIYKDMNCVQAWRVIPINSIVAAIDSVRTRILNFVLEIEAEIPNAGETPINSVSIPKERVTQIFNTYITGNVGNVATGSTNIKQKTRMSEQKEEIFADMLDVLSKMDADPDAISQLSDTVEEMRDAKESERFKAAYQKFMSILADHMQVFGTVLAPYLPALSEMLP